MTTTPVQTAIDLLADAVMASLASETADRGVRSAVSLIVPQRAERAALYDEFLRMALRVQYRLEVLMTLQASHARLAGVLESVIGYPTIMQMLERLVEDLAALTHVYRRLSLRCPRGEYDAAQVVLALTERMAVVEPGWVKSARPGARQSFTSNKANAEERLAFCLRRMDLRIAMDTGPGLLMRRRARRQYGLHIRSNKRHSDIAS